MLADGDYEKHLRVREQDLVESELGGDHQNERREHNRANEDRESAEEQELSLSSIKLRHEEPN